MSSKELVLKFVSTAGQHVLLCSPVINVREEGSESGKRKEPHLSVHALQRMRAAEERGWRSWRVLSDDV